MLAFIATAPPAQPPCLSWEVDMIEVRRVAEGDPLDFEVVSVKEGARPVTT